MASKNISITEDLYNHLLNLKRNDESFSDIIRRLLKLAEKDPLAHFGILNEESAEKQAEFDKAVELFRNESIDHQSTRYKSLWGSE